MKALKMTFEGGSITVTRKAGKETDGLFGPEDNYTYTLAINGSSITLSSDEFSDLRAALDIVED